MSEATAELPHLATQRTERLTRKLAPARLWWAGSVAVGSLLFTVHDHGLIQKPFGNSETADEIQGTLRHLGPTALATIYVTRKLYQAGFSERQARNIGSLTGVTINAANEIIGFALHRKGIDIQGPLSWVISSNPPQLADVAVPGAESILIAQTVSLEEAEALDTGAEELPDAA